MRYSSVRSPFHWMDVVGINVGISSITRNNKVLFSASRIEYSCFTPSFWSAFHLFSIGFRCRRPSHRQDKRFLYHRPSMRDTCRPECIVPFLGKDTFHARKLEADLALDQHTHVQ